MEEREKLDIRKVSKYPENLTLVPPPPTKPKKCRRKIGAFSMAV